MATEEAMPEGAKGEDQCLLTLWVEHNTFHVLKSLSLYFNCQNLISMTYDNVSTLHLPEKAQHVIH